MKTLDYVVIKFDNTPLRYNSGEIGLWHISSIQSKEIELEQGEQFVNITDLHEPFKSELIAQLEKYNVELNI